MTMKTLIKAATAAGMFMALVFITSGNGSLAIAGDKEAVFGREGVAKERIVKDRFEGFERPDFLLRPFFFRERNPFLFERDEFLFDEENVFGFERERDD